MTPGTTLDGARIRKSLVLRLGVLFGVVAVVGLGFRASAADIKNRTVACSARAVTIVFDPNRSVVVRGRPAVLGSATFTAAEINPRCRTIPEPARFLVAGLGAAIGKKVTVRCAAPTPIRLHVNPITENAHVVGTNLLVGFGEQFKVIASAVLKNESAASRLYRSARHCRVT